MFYEKSHVNRGKKFNMIEQFRNDTKYVFRKY